MKVSSALNQSQEKDKITQKHQNTCTILLEQSNRLSYFYVTKSYLPILWQIWLKEMDSSIMLDSSTH